MACVCSKPLGNKSDDDTATYLTPRKADAAWSPIYHYLSYAIPFALAEVARFTSSLWQL